MNEEQIKKGLSDDHRLVMLDEIDSTNEEIKRRVRAGACATGTVIVAERQTAGKGRNGRSFYSPAGTGIYLSVLSDARDDFSDTVMLTTQAAVAVAEAVSSVCKKETQIKWVNDVYLEDKKICGILAEAITDPASGQIRHIVTGIGINVYRPQELPEELRDVLGYIFTEQERVPGLRARLAAEIINRLTAYYEVLPDRGFLSEYRRRSNVIGKPIRYGVPSADGKETADWRSGTAVSIDDTGRLVVAGPDGMRTVLQTGEISVRLKGGEK